jgi:hypothetical protein
MTSFAFIAEKETPPGENDKIKKNQIDMIYHLMILSAHGEKAACKRCGRTA